MDQAGHSRLSSCLGSLLSLLFFAAVTAGVAYAFPELRGKMKDGYYSLFSAAFPCARPATYSFGAFDDRFGVSREDFAAATLEAEGVWELAAGKELFRRVDANGAITVNLTYDHRQQATDTLKNLGVKIDADKAGYERLKAEHDALVAQYEPRKAAFEAALAAHDRRVRAYEEDVEDWNRKGGAPEKEYQRLTAEAAAIDAEARELNQERDALNAMVEQINASVTVLNRLAANVNETADVFNEVSGERGAEFEEGLFTGVVGSGRIDIFEFDGRDRLVRLLIHEMGHSLGMEHVDDDKAVMYRLNNSSSPVLSEADVTELRRVCRMK